MRGRAVLLSLYACCVLMGISCSKNEDVEIEVDYPDYIIFGRFVQADWCSGETCVELYKVQTDGLFEDRLDVMPNGNSLGNTDFSAPLPTSDFSQIMTLLQKRSYEDLFEFSDPTIGNLVNGNFHYYFEFKSKKKHQSWVIDGSFDGSVPGVLQPFLLDLNQIVQIAQF